LSWHVSVEGTLPVGAKVTWLGSRIGTSIVITVALLALLSSFISGPLVGASKNNSSTVATITASTRTRTHIVITTSTTTAVVTWGTGTWSTDGAGYSITFNPGYWLCTDVSVTFTGPLLESGLYGDTLQFQYFQYNPSYPSLLYPIFTDPSLTVTSDTITYWISYSEYAQVNFAYSPNIAVKVVDVTPKPNGYIPGLLFMQLTNVTPESSVYCPYDSPVPAPEFPAATAEWVAIMASVLLALAFLRVHNRARTR